MKKLHHIIAGALLGSAALAAALPAAAQAPAYPAAKPIRIVLPFPAGSSTDSFMRVYTERLREKIGQLVILDPRPGAGAVIATQAVTSQPPDGYTLMMATSSQTITSAKANPPFDIRKDMTHIIQLVGGPVIIGVNVEKLPNAKTVKDLVDYAKANPGKVNFGSYGPGSLGHLAVELFNEVMDVKTVHIPYKGSPANMIALANGDSHAAIDVMTFMAAQIQAGKVRALAVTTQDRSSNLPDLPGMKESGYPGYTVMFWQGLSGPAGMPKDLVTRINVAANATLKEQAVLDYTKKTQTLLVGGTSEAITDIINREVTTWAKLIKEKNIEVN
jgi:tripartite-type tricarboxylate transporter receptor subunit TctC